MSNGNVCPFINGLSKECNKECAMHQDNGCSIITGEKPSMGGWCPYCDPGRGMRCNEYCVFYVSDGCAVAKKG